MIFIFIVFLSV